MPSPKRSMCASASPTSARLDDAESPDHSENTRRIVGSWKSRAWTASVSSSTGMISAEAE